MPLLGLQTNLPLADQERERLATDASVLPAILLGKPERNVMVPITASQSLISGGSAETRAYLEWKSIGLPDSDG